jgi:GT2 family glycosyltransferase/glycosyltransferase involved in cell wall biosynthesis
MADRRDVSIVVTTYNGWHLTKSCLASLVESAQSSALTAEIIISDNCSTDDTPQAWQAFQNDKWPIQYRRNKENLGYLRNANAGAGAARGTFLCLMNNDVIVQPGWLDAMVEVLRKNDDIGLIGPKYLSADGKVVECGGAIFSDGSAVQLGNGTALDDPEFSHVNDVHYCSMACVVLRTQLFRELNGYDERYMPAYYEDVDLCFRVTEHGLRVAVDPLVRITHLFGGSHKLQETLQLMDKNRKILCERWKDRLERLHPPPGTPAARLRGWPDRPTVVFHWPFFLNPNSAAGALRNWLLMMEARKRGNRVIYVGPNEPEDRPYVDTLRKHGIEVHQDPVGEERDLVHRLVSAHPISAAIFSFREIEERYGYLYDEYDPKIIRVFDTVDVHFIRELRSDRRDASQGAIQQIEFGRLSETAYAEMACMLRSDVVLLVSEAEKQILTRDIHLPADKFHIVSTIHLAEPTVKPYAEREGFSFIGYGGHPPNVDSIEQIVTTIWPGIRQQLPTAKLFVYGFKLPGKVLAFDNPSAGIVVRGFAPDHREAISASRVMLAPLRFGAGVKGKIGEALAVGTPVVTTPIGAEGMDGEGRALVVETDVRRLAERAVEIYRDEEKWNHASRMGLDLIQQRFSAARAGDALMHSIDAGRQLRAGATVWKHIAYAVIAVQKNRDSGQDIANRVGRKVTYALYRLRASRNPLVRGLIKLLRASGKSR